LTNVLWRANRNGHLTDENIEVLARRIEPMRSPEPLSIFAHSSWQHLRHLLRDVSDNNKLGWLISFHNVTLFNYQNCHPAPADFGYY